MMDYSGLIIDYLKAITMLEKDKSDGEALLKALENNADKEPEPEYSIKYGILSFLDCYSRDNISGMIGWLVICFVITFATMTFRRGIPLLRQMFVPGLSLFGIINIIILLHECLKDFEDYRRALTAHRRFTEDIRNARNDINCDELKIQLERTEGLLEKYYGIGVIPKEYRKLKCVQIMLGLFEDGKCSEITGKNGAVRLMMTAENRGCRTKNDNVAEMAEISGDYVSKLKDRNTMYAGELEKYERLAQVQRAKKYM